jgi:hypothetical protein
LSKNDLGEVHFVRSLMLTLCWKLFHWWQDWAF